MSPQNIKSIFKGYRFSLTSELALKNDMEKVLAQKGVPYLREHRLDDTSIVDFWIHDCAVEVKIKGSKQSIYEQCKRYCEFDAVKSLLLVTNRAMILPCQINNKDIMVFSLGEAWL